MRRLLCIAIALIMLSGLQACNSNPRKAKNYNDKTPVDDSGASFIKDAVESSLSEVKFSNLAQKNSQNREIRDFAKTMITDHGEFEKVLRKIADNKNINVSDSVNFEHQQLANSLARKTEHDFDKEYIQVIVNDHEKTLKLYREAATNSDKDVKKWASATVAKIEEHLKKANALCARF